MGALSAEARGIVRRELAPVQARNDQVAAARMAALVGTYSARFNEGKRLTADQVNQLGKDVAECLHATISAEGRHFYGQSRPLRIARGDHSYRDTSLELRGAEFGLPGGVSISGTTLWGLNFRFIAWEGSSNAPMSGQTWSRGSSKTRLRRYPTSSCCAPRRPAPAQLWCPLPTVSLSLISWAWQTSTH
jgi:hypothetical protein